jgi:hypothetical protein
MFAKLAALIRRAVVAPLAADVKANESLASAVTATPPDPKFDVTPPAGEPKGDA